MTTRELKATIKMLTNKYRNTRNEITLRNIEKLTKQYIEATNELPTWN